MENKWDQDPGRQLEGLEKVVLNTQPIASDGDLDHFMTPYRHHNVDADLLDDATLLRSFYTLSDTLVFIHSKGMMHRDIKPSNCLVHKGNVCCSPTLACRTSTGGGSFPIIWRARRFYASLRGARIQWRSWHLAQSQSAIGRLLPRLRLR